MSEPTPTGLDATVFSSHGKLAPLRRCPTCGQVFPAEFNVCPKDATALAEAAADQDALVGTVLAGTYRILRWLADGGMGRVYEAQHIRLERRLAVKVLHETFAKSAEGVARFEREARAAGAIRSEHIVQVIDVLRTPDGRPCMVTDLLDGEDLQARLDREGKLPTSQAIPIARQVCLALAAAHAAGIVHRDLKPSNAFLTPRGDGGTLVTILDFGVAKLLGQGDLTQTGAVLGTPAYMSPEQARGAQDVDARTDVYAVGALLYRMLTGEPPYGKDQTSPFLRLHQEPTRPRTLDGTIPEGVEALIQQAMARDPGDRPQSALDLERALAAFDAEPAPGAPVSPAGQITRDARRARPLALGLVLGACVATALGTLALVGSAVRILGRSRALTPTEFGLSILFTAAATGSVAVILGRALAARWSSAPEVRKLGGRLRRALVLGLCTFGGLEILARAWTTLDGTPPSEPWRLARLLAAVAAAVALMVLSR
jgi:eukaryotic-like serine/threonine-protein kinase